MSVAERRIAGEGAGETRRVIELTGVTKVYRTRDGDVPVSARRRGGKL
jgi:hypothetical protein